MVTNKSWTAVTNTAATRLWVKVESTDEEICELVLPSNLQSKDRHLLVSRSSLIAAAPDLLKALRDVVHGFEGKRRLNDGDRLRLANANEAIRKAEGRS